MIHRIKSLLFFSMLILCLFSHNRALAEVYQWTDDDGTEHFSDSPTTGSKGKSKFKKVKMSKKTINNEQTPTDPMNNRNSSTSETNNDKINNRIDAKAEGELKLVWQTYRNALARGDVQSALNQISVNSRAEEAEMYKALGNKLHSMVEVLKDIESIEVRGEWAVGRFYRDKEVIDNGQKVKIDNGSIDFVKENGRWKILKY